MRRHLLIATAAAMLAIPANAAITFTGSFDVAGATADLSGESAAFGGNRLSFGSDLVFDRSSNLFYGITDRGPGGGLISFAPRVHAFRLRTDAATKAVTGFALVATKVFTDESGTKFNGLNPALLNGNPSVLGNSFDPEGLVHLGNGHFLVADEYGPSIYEFDANGKRIRSFTTPANLIPRATVGGGIDYVAGRPDINKGRQDNRGFEGLTLSIDGSKAYAIMQDPLVNEGASNQGRNSRNLRIVEFNVATGLATAQFIYQVESLTDINGRIPGTASDFANNAQGRSIGVSSVTALADGSFLVIERDNRGLGVDDPTGANQIGTKRVYRISLDGATDVSNTSLAGSNSLPSGVVPVGKTLWLDVQSALLAAGVVDPLEKLEGLSFGRNFDGGVSLFLVTDNDFSVTQTGVFGAQTDVCTSGDGGSSEQIAIGGTCTGGRSLIPTRVYGFTITGADAQGLVAVPEPASWAMLIAGFGLTGAAMRRRRLAGATKTA